MQVLSKRRLDDEIRQVRANTDSEQVRGYSVIKFFYKFYKTVKKAVKNFIENTTESKGLIGLIERIALSSLDAGEAVYEEYLAQQNSSSLRLTEEELRQYGELRNKLLKRLRKLPKQDSFSLGRITRKVITMFRDAINSKKPSTRRIKLEAIESVFSDYAPYWFYRAKAALELEDDEMAEKYFARFMNVWRKVLFLDPFVAAAMKYKAMRLMHEGINQANVSEIYKCLEEMIANAPQITDDWTNNIFVGMVYFSLGDRKKAEGYFEHNIENNLECEESSKLLEYIRTAELPNKIEPLPGKTESMPLRLPELASDVQESSPPISDDDFVELCKSGDVIKVEKEIINGANVNAVSAEDNDGEPALIWATKKGHTKIVDILLKRGAESILKVITAVRL